MNMKVLDENALRRVHAGHKEKRGQLTTPGHCQGCGADFAGKMFKHPGTPFEETKEYQDWKKAQCH